MLVVSLGVKLPEMDTSTTYFQQWGACIWHCTATPRHQQYPSPCQKHKEFPSKYCSSQMLLNFSVRMGTGVSNMTTLATREVPTLSWKHFPHPIANALHEQAHVGSFTERTYFYFKFRFNWVQKLQVARPPNPGKHLVRRFSFVFQTTMKRSVTLTVATLFFLPFFHSFPSLCVPGRQNSWLKG